MFLEVNPCFQKAHVFCMNLQPAADPYNVVCIDSHSMGVGSPGVVVTTHPGSISPDRSNSISDFH